MRFYCCSFRWLFPVVLVLATAIPSMAQDTTPPPTGDAANVNPVQLLQRVTPVYPPLARKAGIDGDVFLDVIIGVDGSVKSATALRGDPFLTQAAVDAVRQWKYKPSETEARTQVTVNFSMDSPIVPDVTTVAVGAKPTSANDAPAVPSKTIQTDNAQSDCQQVSPNPYGIQIGRFTLGESVCSALAKAHLQAKNLQGLEQGIRRIWAVTSSNEEEMLLKLFKGSSEAQNLLFSAGPPDGILGEVWVFTRNPLSVERGNLVTKYGPPTQEEVKWNDFHERYRELIWTLPDNSVIAVEEGHARHKQYGDIRFTGVRYISHETQSSSSPSVQPPAAQPLPNRAAEALGGSELEIAKAQFNKGNAYHYGQGVQKDYQEALLWYTKAADQGDPRAEYMLGAMYSNGEGTPRDEVTGANWYRKAAEQGLQQAQYQLGQAYVVGRGVPIDAALAAHLFQQSAEQGNTDAQYNLGVAYNTGAGVPKSNTEALRWYRKAAEQGDGMAQHALAVMYHNGEGVPKDNEEAFYWLSLADVYGDDDPIVKQQLAQTGATLTHEKLQRVQERCREWVQTHPHKSK